MVFLRGVGGLLAGGGNLEIDADIVGDDVELGPGAFADREVAAAYGQATGEHAVLALGGEAGRDDDRLCAALDRQLAGDLVAVVAERLDAGRDEARGREVAAVEPRLAGDFLVALGGPGVDAGQLDVDRRPAAAGRAGSKLSCAANLRKRPSIRTPICW
jgi:hypothetical protein